MEIEKRQINLVPPADPQHPTQCGFCGKDRDEVRKLIAGPLVAICDECIRMCMDIID